VESFVFSTETLMNSAIRDIKAFVNTELAGLKGPAKQFAGQCTLSSPAHDLVLTNMADLMGTTGRMGGGDRTKKATKCIVASFGLRPDGTASFRVCCMY
jgi:hypothetical protein